MCKNQRNSTKYTSGDRKNAHTIKKSPVKEIVHDQVAFVRTQVHVDDNIQSQKYFCGYHFFENLTEMDSLFFLGCLNLAVAFVATVGFIMYDPITRRNFQQKFGIWVEDDEEG